MLHFKIGDVEFWGDSFEEVKDALDYLAPQKKTGASRSQNGAAAADTSEPTRVTIPFSKTWNGRISSSLTEIGRFTSVNQIAEYMGAADQIASIRTTLSKDKGKRYYRNNDGLWGLKEWDLGPPEQAEGTDKE